MKKTYISLFQQTPRNRLERKEGGGCIGCFGVPFFLAGLFVFLISVNIIPVSNADDIPWWGWILMLFMGLAFTGVGGALVFGRRWISIDRMQRRIWIAWGLLKPMKGSVYSLDKYSDVTLRYIAGDSDSPDKYNVSLKANDNSKELELFSSTTYGTSLDQAVLISKFLHLPLEDNSTDHPSEAIPESMESGQIPKLQEKQPDISPQPDVMKCEVRCNENELQIKLPGPALKPLHFLGLLIPLGFILFKGFPTILIVNNINISQLALLTFGIIMLFKILRALVLTHKFTTIAYVDSKGILIEYLFTTKTKIVRIPANEIVGIDYSTCDSIVTSAVDGANNAYNSYSKMGGLSAPYSGTPWWIPMLKKLTISKGILIKSRKTLYSFGAGLPDAEVYHLYTLVRHYLYQAESKESRSEV